MDFVAIDFETANHEPSSACQLGLVVVQDGQIVDEKSWLIKPPNEYFSPRCIAVHGIYPEDVVDAPTWDIVWREARRFLDSQVAIAHNAMFDMNVLLHSILAYDESAPRIDFLCTRLIARRTWPGRTGYGLHPTATSLGIQFRHHDALEDARACAKICLEAHRVAEALSLEELEERLSIRRGYIEHATRSGPRAINRKKAAKRAAAVSASESTVAEDAAGYDSQQRSSIASRSYSRSIPRSIRSRELNDENLRQVDSQALFSALCDSVGDAQPFRERRIVLQGTLFGMSRDLSFEFISRLGGLACESLGEGIDFLIIGSATPTKQSCESVTVVIPKQSDDVKQVDTPNRNSLGAAFHNQNDCVSMRQTPVRILSQRQLLAFIPGGMDVARSITGG